MTASFDELTSLIARTWGFRTLRPNQEAAMRAIMDRLDSLLVLPTGGGKSLCYQAPAAARSDELTVVVSPLIALMKDQVDALREVGVSAVRIDSTLSDGERRSAFEQMNAGQIRLLYCSPEKLVNDNFRDYLRQRRVRTFVIDEAHCISHWGHQFRPEYRQLKELRTVFPDAAMHAFTATATPRVRDDIVEQLGLRQPSVIVGNFDRPNLVYRSIQRRDDGVAQVIEVLERHRGEAGIIYCITRKEVDQLTATLRARGYEARRYRAKNPEESEPQNQAERKEVQDLFRRGKCNLIVATVAFGMGVDRPDLRFVLHTGLPKSLEHYQQEAGRAGRDGLPAECVLIHSARDVMTWRFIIDKSAPDAPDPEHFRKHSLNQLKHVEAYADGSICRHRALVQYFGQEFPADNCANCDVCLNDVELEPEGTIIAQKILSCVYRVNERFGVEHIINVLRGAEVESIRRFEHEKLSTYGLLRDQKAATIRNWLYQLIGGGWLDRSEGDRPVLKLNEKSWHVLRKQADVRLVRRRVGRERKARSVAANEDYHSGLIEVLRAWRLNEAERRGHPPYVIFHDSTLRELARVKPTNEETLRRIPGIGERKIESFGAALLAVIANYCRDHQLESNIGAVEATVRNSAQETADALFRTGARVLEVAEKMDRAPSTVVEHLCDFIARERPASVATWVDESNYQAVASVVAKIGAERLKPIFDALDGKVSYEKIRIVVAHLRSMGKIP